MAEESKNIKRIAGTDEADISSQLIPRQIGMENTKNQLAAKFPSGDVKYYTPKGGDAEYNSLNLSGFSVAGNLEVDINGEVIIGSASGIEEAPVDGKQYAREDATWTEILPDDTKQDVLTAGDGIIINNDVISTTPYTTAGLTTRMFFTADTFVVGGTNYLNLSTDDKGIGTSFDQGINPVDLNTLYPYATEWIREIQATQILPKGSYSGQIHTQSTSSNAQYKLYVEAYLSDENGVLYSNPDVNAIVGTAHPYRTISIGDTGIIELPVNDPTTINFSANIINDIDLIQGHHVVIVLLVEQLSGLSNANFTVYSGSDYNTYYDFRTPVLASTVLDDSSAVYDNVKEHLQALDAVSGATILYDGGWVNNVSISSFQESFAIFKISKETGSYYNSGFGDLLIEITNSTSPDVKEIYRITMSVPNGSSVANVNVLARKFNGTGYSNQDIERFELLYDGNDTLAGDVYLSMKSANGGSSVTNVKVLAYAYSNLVDASGLIVPSNFTARIYNTLNGTSDIAIKSDIQNSSVGARTLSLTYASDSAIITNMIISPPAGVGDWSLVSIGQPLPNGYEVVSINAMIVRFGTYSVSQVDIDFRLVSADGTLTSSISGNSGTSLFTHQMLNIPNTSGTDRFYYKTGEKFSTGFGYIYPDNQMLFATISSQSLTVGEGVIVNVLLQEIIA